MSYRIYWRRNDGVSGHVWLSAGDMDALAVEMTLQGMPWPGDRLPESGADAVLTADEVESAIAAARETPLGISDGQLWIDWLVFLEGAIQNGGLLIRA
ncbi:MAG: hypothetical protein LH654_00985 [Thermoleophilia bacterium]|nr:hypothetical protein [Thermoleophilia bacterium]